ncbi:diguanylate cyclase [Chitinibacter sp. GC72]|uniref:sensor domain-containing diguanylate cyclase n=1 Tax=Chitinibacter sp. GC72 TaxID=1526917 RepID=UPI0012FA11C7|nr:diguanylate cyclase [Chitinibacter sp. GC72]
MRWHRNRITITVALAAMIGFGMILFLAYQVSASYRAAENHARGQSAALLALQEAQFKAQFREVELQLTNTNLQIAPLLTAGQSANLGSTLQQHLQLIPQADHIALIDLRGQLLAQAEGASPFELDFLPLLDQLKQQGIVYHTGGSGQPPELIIGLKPAEQSASFLALARIRPGHLEQALATSRLKSGQSLYLLDAQLRILASTPRQSNLSALEAELSGPIKQKQRRGAFLSQKSDQLISLQQIGASPLYLVSTLPTPSYLAEWQKKLAYYTTAASLMLLLTAVMAYYFWRSRRLTQNLKAKERKLSASETRFKQMIETTPVGLVLARMPDFYITYINQHAAKMFGLPQAAALSKRAFELYYDRVDFLHHSEDALAGKAVNNAECILRHKEGNPFWANVSMSASTSNDGTTLLIGLNDITQRKQLEDELKRRATTDSLSGLANRAYFMETAQQEIQRTKRYQRRACILMLDIDFFKKINDNYGHQTGDQVIRTMANLCRASLRDIDLIARIGGEEFTAFLPETTLDEAYLAAERLRIRIEENVIMLDDGREIRFTSSIGISEIMPDDPNVDAPLKRADTALYASKHSGRNKSTCFEHLPTDEQAPKDS